MNSLPRELHFLIVDFLNCESLCQFFIVNKQWSLFFSEKVWEKLLDVHFGISILQYLNGCKSFHVITYWSLAVELFFNEFWKKLEHNVLYDISDISGYFFQAIENAGPNQYRDVKIVWDRFYSLCSQIDIEKLLYLESSESDHGGLNKCDELYCCLENALQIKVNLNMVNHTETKNRKKSYI